MNFVNLPVVDFLWKMIDFRKQQIIDKSVLDLNYFIDFLFQFLKRQTSVRFQMVNVSQEDLNMFRNRDPFSTTKRVEEFFLK